MLPARGPHHRHNVARVTTARPARPNVRCALRVPTATATQTTSLSCVSQEDIKPPQERVTARSVQQARLVTHTEQLRAVPGEYCHLFLIYVGRLTRHDSCSGWYTDQTGQTHCFNCPNRGSFQQGWSPVGATSANQCIAAGGALSSCSVSGSSCRMPLPFVAGLISVSDKSYLIAATGGAQPSGIPSNNKRTYMNSQTSLRSSHKCARGYRSCPVYGTAFKRSFLKTYECVDTDNELESCGGCVHMDSPHGEVNLDGGRDCSAIPNVDSVRCQEGKCLIGELASFFLSHGRNLNNLVV